MSSKGGVKMPTENGEIAQSIKFGNRRESDDLTAGSRSKSRRMLLAKQQSSDMMAFKYFMTGEDEELNNSKMESEKQKTISDKKNYSSSSSSSSHDSKKKYVLRESRCAKATFKTKASGQVSEAPSVTAVGLAPAQKNTPKTFSQMIQQTNHFGTNR